MDICIDDLRDAAIAALLQAHLDAMHKHSLPVCRLQIGRVRFVHDEGACIAPIAI
jgi:hypothetical protein